MAQAKAGLGLEDVTASVKRMRVEGERLVSRLRREAGALTGRSRREALSALLGDARKVQEELRKRATRAVQDIEKRRDRILAKIEEQVIRTAELLIKRLRVATLDDIGTLRARIADLERRLDTLAKETKEKEGKAA